MGNTLTSLSCSQPLAGMLADNWCHALDPLGHWRLASSRLTSSGESFLNVVPLRVTQTWYNLVERTMRSPKHDACGPAVEKQRVFDWQNKTMAQAWCSAICCMEQGVANAPNAGRKEACTHPAQYKQTLLARKGRECYFRPTIGLRAFGCRWQAVYECVIFMAAHPPELAFQGGANQGVPLQDPASAGGVPGISR